MENRTRRALAQWIISRRIPQHKWNLVIFVNIILDKYKIMSHFILQSIIIRLLVRPLSLRARTPNSVVSISAFPPQPKYNYLFLPFSHFLKKICFFNVSPNTCYLFMLFSFIKIISYFIYSVPLTFLFNTMFLRFIHLDPVCVPYYFHYLKFYHVNAPYILSVDTWTIFSLLL